MKKFFRKTKTPEVPKSAFQVVAEYAQALVGAILLAILIRGFLFEPFKIPSESMVPTLLVGDHIFVARYKYGLRIPFTKIWIKKFEDPKRGDVVVFNYPQDESLDFIKRVIGLPGDRVSMKDGQLFVNDQAVEEKLFFPNTHHETDACIMDLIPESESVLPGNLKPFPYYLKHKKFDQEVETLPSAHSFMMHMIQHSKEEPIVMDFEVTVPTDSYFVMGDNRDQSHDSRFWGFVPRKNLKGKAMYIWLSLNNEKRQCAHNLYEPFYTNVLGKKVLVPNIRWDRFGREII